MTSATTATDSTGLNGLNGAAQEDSREAILELRGVNKIFRDFWLRPRVRAVQDLELTVRRGEVLGLLGPNGSGKTTTIKMILGLLHPTAGQIAVLGKRPSDVKLKHRIGYLPEESHLYRFLNAEETLDFYGRLFKIPAHERRGRVESLLEMVGLSAARYRPVGEYSKGMQRRVGLAQALINDPDLLILDEPTTGMDPIATRQIKDLIRNLKDRGKTIILCTHLLGEVEDVCDRLIIMYGGKIRAQGTVEELLTVTGRQELEITGGPMDETTVDRLRSALADQGREIESVRAPRQRLENLFMDVIEQATRGGEETTGAGVGGDMAGFLASQPDEGEKLLESLTTPTAPVVEPTTEPEPAAPVVAEPDRDVLDEMSTARPIPEPEPVPPAAPESKPKGESAAPRRETRESKPSPASEADEDFLSNLTGKS